VQVGTFLRRIIMKRRWGDEDNDHLDVFVVAVGLLIVFAVIVSRFVTAILAGIRGLRGLFDPDYAKDLLKR